jgi:hypothetical protein
MQITCIRLDPEDGGVTVARVSGHCPSAGYVPNTKVGVIVRENQPNHVVQKWPSENPKLMVGCVRKGRRIWC